MYIRLSLQKYWKQKSPFFGIYSLFFIGWLFSLDGHIGIFTKIMKTMGKVINMNMLLIF